MKQNRVSEPDPIQYRIRFRLGKDVTPVVRYFMAISSEQALEEFAYSCRNSQPGPELLDFMQFNRWTDEWIPEMAKEVAQELLQSLLEKESSKILETESTVADDAGEEGEFIHKILAKYQDRYEDPRFYIRGRPNPKYKREMERLENLITKPAH